MAWVVYISEGKGGEINKELCICGVSLEMNSSTSSGPGTSSFSIKMG